MFYAALILYKISDAGSPASISCTFLLFDSVGLVTAKLLFSVTAQWKMVSSTEEPDATTVL